jgi:hypothetical protein
VDFGLILVKYGLERILFRLSRSPYHHVLILKGALPTIRSPSFPGN